MAFYLRPSSLIVSGRWIASGLQTSRPLKHFCQQPHCVSESQTRRPSFKTCTLRKAAETPSQQWWGWVQKMDFLFKRRNSSERKGLYLSEKRRRGKSWSVARFPGDRAPPEFPVWDELFHCAISRESQAGSSLSS